MDPSKQGARVFRFTPPAGYEHLDFTADIRHIGRQMCTDGYLGGGDAIEPAFVITITNGYDMHCTPLDSDEGRRLVGLWDAQEVELTGLVAPSSAEGKGKILVPYIVVKR